VVRKGDNNMTENLQQKLNDQQRTTLFEEYKKVAYGIQMLGGIIQNPPEFSTVDFKQWLSEVATRQAELDDLIKQTVRYLGVKVEEVR